ncbi:MAG: MCE family protein [Gammaproteobacteria bacterium]|jgi:paraquat-inducible protein B|nr:MCE family protein [Gammaproteobacteria bacterium]
MSKKSNPAVIGAFVVGAVSLLALGVALFGGGELFKKRFNYVAYFEEQTKGLRPGSNVILNGVRVGYVSEIALLIDEDRYETLTRVTLEILPDTYIPVRDGVPIAEDLRDVIPHEELIEDAGLRAQLEIESFVTGQLLVRLDLRPDTPISMTGIESDYPEIPTIRSDIQELLARMQRWLANIRDNVDVDALAEGVTNALNGIAALTNSPDLHESLAGLSELVNDEDVQKLGTSLRKALDDVSDAASEASTLFRSADEEILSVTEELQPVLERLGETLLAAEKTLDTARLQLRGDSEQAYQLRSTLREVEGAAAAMREFFDYLERNPEALIQGKQP